MSAFDTCVLFRYPQKRGFISGATVSGASVYQNMHSLARISPEETGAD